MNIELTASDGHKLAAWRVEPEGRARGAVVVAQEIFGVNSHIRSVCADYAAEGYIAIAPALFDRIERGVDIGYTPDDIARGRDLKGKASMDGALQDVAAAVASVKAAGRRTGLVGYCWGGAIAWAASAKVPGLAASCGYYGGGIPEMTDIQPKCPVILHFGEKDQAIPIDGVRAFAAKRPEVPVHLYPAGHGFNCDQRGSWDAASAALARERTLAFFRENVG